MKKALVFAVFVLFLCFSCGIDDIIYLEPPSRTWDPSGLADESKLYFEFTTSDAANTTNAAGYFKGFDIFYRIFEYESECIAAIASARSYNESYPSASAAYLSSSLSFRFLTYTGRDSSDRPLIGSAASDRQVRFRFSTYGSDSDIISINSLPLGRSLRQNGMDFQHIVRTDSDVKPGSTPSTVPFLHVAVFAAAYGTDNALRPMYSEITYIGYVKIPKPSGF